TGKILLSQKSPIVLERPVPTYQSSGSGDYSVEVSADGRRLTETLPLSVKVWDLTQHREVFAFHGQTNTVVWSPDRLRVATVVSGAYRRPLGKQAVPGNKTPEEDMFRLWDVASGKEILTLQATVSNVTFSPDGRFVAAIKHLEGSTGTVTTAGVQVNV